jgi:hypothetical protein
MAKVGQLKPYQHAKILPSENFFLVKGEQFVKIVIRNGDRGLLPNHGFAGGMGNA